MLRERGSTLMELLTVIAVTGVFAAIAVPSASRAAAGVSGALGARRLALVLREAQAEAQSRGAVVRVSVGADGEYLVSRDGATVARGDLGAPVTGTYPGGVIEFTEAGWPRLPGASGPRAGHFSVEGGRQPHVVIVQLSGCVRCS